MKNYTELSKKAFNEQAKYYDDTNYSRHARELYPYMLNEIIHIQGNDILDIGCGSGALMAQVVSEDRDRKVTGIDISNKMLEVAYERLHNKVILVEGDAQQLPFADASFDLVYCNDSFHHYPQPQVVIAEMRRVLRKGGTLLIGDCFAKGIERKVINFFLPLSNEGDVHMYSKKEIEALCMNMFDNVIWKQISKHAYIIRGEK